MHRVGIFVFYDSEGVADDYVICLLKGIKKCLDKIICIINGKINNDSYTKLSEVCDEMVVRENDGYDIAAYKEGIRYIKEEKEEWDEVVFFNATVYGPIYPFQEMFSEMEKKELDFWGITKHAKSSVSHILESNLDYIPEHIQSYFFAVRKPMFYSKEFDEYWNSMKEIKKYSDAVLNHEIVFTNYFFERGYIWDTYIKTPIEEDYYEYVLMANPLFLLENQRCPVIKRKTFLHSLPEAQLVYPCSRANELLDFVKNNTEYNDKLIIENLIRTESIRAYENALFSLINLDEIDINEKYEKKSVAIYVEAKSLAYIDHYSVFSEENVSSVTFLCYSQKVMDNINTRIPWAKTELIETDLVNTFSQLIKREKAKYILFTTNRDFKPDKMKREYLDFMLGMEELYKVTHICNKPDILASVMEKDNRIGALIPVPSLRNTEVRRETAMKSEGNIGIDVSALYETSYTFLAQTDEIAKTLGLFERLNKKEKDEYFRNVASICAKNSGKIIGYITDRTTMRSTAMMYIPIRREMNKQGELVDMYDHARAFMYDFLTEQSIKERIWFLLLSLLPFKRKALYEKYKRCLIDKSTFYSQNDYE